MYYGLKRAVRLVNDDPDLPGLVITGVGDVFSAVNGICQGGGTLSPNIGRRLTYRSAHHDVDVDVNPWEVWL